VSLWKGVPRPGNLPPDCFVIANPTDGCEGDRLDELRVGFVDLVDDGKLDREEFDPGVVHETSTFNP
jgi:hypothetical protein